MYFLIQQLSKDQDCLLLIHQFAVFIGKEFAVVGHKELLNIPIIICRVDVTVCKMFSDATRQGRRLDVIFITSNGNKDGDLVGLITVWDIAKI